MDEMKLSKLIFEQRPVPAQAFDDKMTRQVHRLAGETQVMKKKLSVLAICVMIILSLALFGAVAEMLGLNLFELFGQRDHRLKELAPQAALNETVPVTTTSAELGEAVAGINSAYYDGQSLLVGYSIQNGRRIERFVPGEEMLSKMSLMDPQIGIVAENEDEALLMKEWIAAKESGNAMGIVRYSVSPSDSTVTDDGIDLPTTTESQMAGEENTVHYIREYENPLPDEAQDQDSLSFQIGLYQGASYLYFDGKNTYAYSESKELEPMRGSAWRADGEVRQFKGEGTYNGYPVSAEAFASAAVVRVTLTMDGGIFPALGEDTWYDLVLLDENGTKYRVRGGNDGNVKEMSVSYDGTGKLPDSLTLRILVESENDGEKTHSDAEPIVLRLIGGD